MKPRTIDQIIALIPRLGTENFLGLAHLLEVDILTTDWDRETRKAIPRDAMEIVVDCVNKISTMSEEDQQFYLKLIKKSAEK